jgi:outer membrane receptor for ferrienterochelin and colicins
MKALTVLIALILVISPQVLAEDVELSKIVVTASRVDEDKAVVSRSIDVVTAEDIQESQAQDLSQALTGLTSVNISNYGGLGATKTIRMGGSTASQVLVLVDGRPVNSPRDGEAELSNIPLENIDRIELMHGPGSSLYGAGAMGGTLNIITKNPPQEKQKTSIYSSFGTFHTYVEQLTHAGRLSNFGYLLSGTYQSSRGFRDNSELSSKDVNAKLEYELNHANTLKLNSGFYKSKLGTPGKITEPDIDDKQQTLKNFQDLTWSFKPDDTTALSAKIYQNYDRLEFIENSAGSAFDIANNKDIHATTVRGYDLQLSKYLSDNYQGIFGFNYVTNLNDSTTSAKHEYTVRAAYLENKFDLFQERLRLNLGARLDDYSNFGTEINPSFSGLYTLNEDVKLHGLISRSFRAPTFNDLYWPDQGWAKGNPGLSPEKGITQEIGIESRINEHLVSGINYYRNDYDDLINWTEVAGVWQPSNIDSALIDGVEFMNKLKVTDRLGLNLGYTFLKAKDKDTHNYLVYQPKNKADFSLAYRDLNGFVCKFKGQFTDRRFHDAQNSVYVKRFFVFGLSASKRFKSGITYFMSIDNLLNRQYQVIKDYPMPGFSLTSAVKLEF